GTMPLGVPLDGIMTEGQDDDYSFDTVWVSDGHLTPDGYVVRFAISFRRLRFRREAAQSWGIGRGRFIRRYNEESYWPYITKRISGYVPSLRRWRDSRTSFPDATPGPTLTARSPARPSRMRACRPSPRRASPGSGWAPRRVGAG